MILVTWGATNRYWRPLDSIAPHSGVGGWAPIPKNPIPDVVNTAFPKFKVARTIHGDIMLGRICDTIIRKLLAPRALAASRYAPYLIASVSLRAMRAKFGTV